MNLNNFGFWKQFLSLINLLNVFNYEKILKYNYFNIIYFYLPFLLHISFNLIN